MVVSKDTEQLDSVMVGHSLVSRIEVLPLGQRCRVPGVECRFLVLVSFAFLSSCCSGGFLRLGSSCRFGRNFTSLVVGCFRGTKDTGFFDGSTK